MKTKRFLPLIVAATLMLSGCAGFGGIKLDSVGKPDTVTYLKVALNQTTEHPSYKALEFFGKEFSKATGGRYQIEIFPNEQLGSQQEVLQMVKSGAIEMAIVSGTQLENVNKDFQVLDMPTTFTSIDQQIAVLKDREIVGKLFESLEKRDNITVLGGYTQGSRNVYTTDRVIKTPADLKGLKIRVQESDMHIRMIELMGGSATPLSYGEVYSALQAGVLDGAENNAVSYNTAKHMEVANHYAYTNHLIGLDYMILRADLFRAVPEKDRNLLIEKWNDSMDFHTKLWIDYTKESEEIAKEHGAEFNEVDSEAFFNALQPIKDQFVVTPYQKDLYAKIRAVADELEAGTKAATETTQSPASTQSPAPVAALTAPSPTQSGGQS
ncbi:MAG: TRAP transporter substrate-binding protein [Mobiluncus porci]|uniref:TRAP transporter substrate-binding protein n=1 Tax=Mobiluncus porci TaxID=2652278 RepID=UPI0023F27BAB|nr:TRAP transporter substrate-binding protein [Mobiluncus porci]MDD7541681.1 TRAP transporter substrate-binding protein [Mobiluncus porci]MDY5749252.1 TRAP transporter substrate-binding protein [Mobiluncus porci]